MTAWDDVAAVAKPVVDLLEGKYLAADAKATLLTSELAAANQTAATLGLQLTDVNLQLAAVQKQLKDLQSQTPPTTPVPPVPTYKAKFGTGGGNSDRTAEKMSMDRRYYNSTQTASCITATKKNQAAGIITWSTFKVPNDDWAGAVAGKYDAWFTDLMAKLKALDYETWVDVHHEPEGDGDLTAWRGMQDRYSRMVPAGSKIKF